MFRDDVIRLAIETGLRSEAGVSEFAYLDRLEAFAERIERTVFERERPDGGGNAWPKARDVGRLGDMDPQAHLRIGLDDDNDVYVSVWDGEGGASVEFCAPAAGGGQSPRTREALIALMRAIEADNAECPGKDWWRDGRNGDRYMFEMLAPIQDACIINAFTGATNEPDSVHRLSSSRHDSRPRPARQLLQRRPGRRVHEDDQPVAGW